MWRDRIIKIELKAAGTQVAAPPTPGYEQVGSSARKPIVVKNIGVAWNRLATWLGVTSVTGEEGMGYPKPWAEEVDEGERNKSLYVEAHRLREAGLSLAMAKDIIKTRLQLHYQDGVSWHEAERTIESAYRKGAIPTMEGPRNELRHWW